MKAFIALFAAALIATAADADQSTNRPALTIKANFSVFDLKNYVFIYSNNVPGSDPTNDVVVFDPPAKPGDPPTILTCVWLVATRGTNGKIDTITAHERVRIDHGDRRARAGLGVYTATNEQIVLTGAFDPSDTNGLPALLSPQGNLYGPKIVYDRMSDRLLMPEGVTTVIPPSALSSTNRDKTNKLLFNDKLFSPKPKPSPANQ